MSTVTLTGVWLSLAADPSEYRAFPYVTALQPSTAVQGVVRLLANGRERVVRRAGRSTPMTLTFETTQADVSWLEDHVGETVCVRDDMGRKFFGAFFEVLVQEDTVDRDRPVVSLTIRSVSFSEAV